MERNWNRNARAAGGARSQPIDVEDESVEYRDDVSKYTVSLNNTSSQDTSDEAIGRSTGDRSSKEEVVEAGTGGDANMSLLRTKAPSPSTSRLY